MSSPAFGFPICTVAIPKLPEILSGVNDGPTTDTRCGADVNSRYCADIDGFWN